MKKMFIPKLLQEPVFDKEKRSQAPSYNSILESLRSLIFWPFSFSKIRFLKLFGYTLLEVLIVIALIGMISGVVAWNIRGALMQQRFKTEVFLIVDKLKLAQNMMLLLGADVHVRFLKGSDGIEVLLESDGELPPKWQEKVNRSASLLKEIHFIGFNDELDFPKKEGGHDILFFSNGSVMSRGLMFLSTHDDPENTSALNRVICLKGMPHPIRAEVYDRRNNFTCDQKQAEDQKLTEETEIEIKSLKENEIQKTSQPAH